MFDIGIDYLATIFDRGGSYNPLTPPPPWIRRWI